MTQLTINITTEHYKQAQYCGHGDIGWISSTCAIAVAMEGIFDAVQVGLDDFGATIGDGYCCIPLPPVAKEMVRRFDLTPPGQRPALPEFSFSVELPEELVAAIELPKFINHSHIRIESVL